MAMPVNNDEMNPDDGGAERTSNVTDYKRTCIDFIEDISGSYLEWVDFYSNRNEIDKDEDKKRFDTNEYRRESSLRGAIQPYDHYSGDYYSDRYESNKNVVTARNPYGRLPRRIEDDPEYEEFMEFKAMKHKSRGRTEPVQRIDRGHQLNELLLYVFTGFFLLVIYDNIYRLGKKSY